MSEKMNPITRQEKFLAKAAGQDVITPKPITRIEKFLQNLIDHISTIGNGGSGTSVQSDLSQTDTTKGDYVKGILRKESLPGNVPYIEKPENQTILSGYVCIEEVDESGNPTKWGIRHITSSGGNAGSGSTGGVIGGGTGTSIQPDLSQNDPTAADYVKNRTHWKGEENISTLLENYTSVEYSSGEERKAFTFIPNQRYKVVWNGTVYDNLVCFFSDGYNVIADYTLGCPFHIDDDGGDGLYVESSDEWTVSIYADLTEWHKLDIRYLPDDISVSWGNVTGKPGGYYEKTNYAHLLHVDAQFPDDDSHMQDIDAPADLLVIGKTYYPVINGEELDPVVAKEYVGQYVTNIVIGNPSLHNPLHENSGEDYLLEINQYGSCDLYIRNAVTNGVETFDLYGEGEVLVAIPEEIISPKIARVSDIPDAIINPSTATVGQTIVVKAVDENSKPTEWEAVDMNVLTSPNGTKYKITVADDGTLSATAVTA